MTLPGANASTFCASSFWNSLADVLEHDKALLFCLAPKRTGKPFENPFFSRSLSEREVAAGPVSSCDRLALELTARVFDSLLARPLKRLNRGPACSPFCSRRSFELASPLLRGWDRVARRINRWERVPCGVG